MTITDTTVGSAGPGTGASPGTSAASTGTAGPTAQWKVEKGVVDAGTATFDVQQPDGPLFKFTLTIVKGRVEGDMAGTRDGVVRGHAKVEATKAK